MYDVQNVKVRPERLPYNRPEPTNVQIQLTRLRKLIKLREEFGVDEFGTFNEMLERTFRRLMSS